MFYCYSQPLKPVSTGTEAPGTDENDYTRIVNAIGSRPAAPLPRTSHEWVMESGTRAVVKMIKYRRQVVKAGSENQNRIVKLRPHQ